MTDGPNHNPPRSSTGSGPKARAGVTVSDDPGILDRDASRAFAQAIARSLLDDKCEDVIVLDVAELTTVTSCIVIGSGTSDRQMRSTLDHLDEVAERFDTKVSRVSKDDGTTWLLADFVDVVVHLFEPNARAYYDLESMWIEAPRLDPAPPASGAKTES